MDQESPNSGKRGGKLTTLFLSLGTGFIMLFFLNLVSLGVFFWVLASVFGIVLLGFLHYTVWGHSLSEEVAHERRQEDARMSGERHFHE